MIKKIFYGLLIAIFAIPAFLYGINDSRIRKMVSQIHATYPAANLQDIYKTCYQDYWGAEHMTPDSASAAAYLEYELAQAAADTMLMPDIELCGWRHHYCRQSLARVINNEMSKETLLSEFLAASTHPYFLPLRKQWAWKLEWHRIHRIALKEVQDWQNEELEMELTEAAEQCAAVHHSQAFRDAYHPHYRLTINK